jgi:hypothetical protein
MQDLLYYIIILTLKKNIIKKETSNVRMLNGSVMNKLANNGSLDTV